jgi:hypothetical protein
MANTAVRSAFTYFDKGATSLLRLPPLPPSCRGEQKYRLNLVVQQTKIRVSSVNNYPKSTRDFSKTVKLVIDSERRPRETKIGTRTGEAARATKLTLEQRAEIARIAARCKNQPS